VHRPPRRKPNGRAMMAPERFKQWELDRWFPV